MTFLRSSRRSQVRTEPPPAHTGLGALPPRAPLAPKVARGARGQPQATASPLSHSLSGQPSSLSSVEPWLLLQIGGGCVQVEFLSAYSETAFPSEQPSLIILVMNVGFLRGADIGASRCGAPHWGPRSAQARGSALPLLPVSFSISSVARLSLQLATPLGAFSISEPQE